MGISLDIQGVQTNKVFTPHEAVKGVVRLELDRPTVISDVTLSLEGSIRTSLIEKGPAFILGNDVPKVADENHQLLIKSKVLFPYPNTPFIARGHTLAQGQYVFPFVISFPSSIECSTHRVTMLPPSFESHTAENGAQANVAYTLRVGITRRTRLRKVISTEQNLTFLPFDPAPALLSSLGTGCLARRKGLYVSSHNSPGCARTVLPILLLEAKLPSPPFLYPGERLPLRLCVRSLPMPIQYILPIQLQRLTISIRSMTSITAAIGHTFWASSQKLLDLHGLEETINCDRESDVVSEIKPGIIQSVAIPLTVPSFTTCTVEHKYTLEVNATFSLREPTKQSSIKLVINVEILSGNDSATVVYTEDVGEDADTILPILLRRGCLTHLGALNAADRERDPPPY